MKAASGRYINFLDADDKWDNTACKAALDFFSKNTKVNIACFPIMSFEGNKNAHWLNYKFKQTKVADIFKDTDAAVLDACASFSRREAIQERYFDETLPVSEETVWVGKLLLDEQKFDLITKPYYRRRVEQNSAVVSKADPLPYYLDVPRLCHLEILHHAKAKYSEIPRWAQYAVMLDLETI